MGSTNEPPAVRRVSITASEFMMTVPSFIDQNGSVEDRRVAVETIRISKEIRVLLGQFFLFVAMTRSKEFTDACKVSNAKEGVAIVVGSLMRTMVVAVAALFDDDSGTSNIPKMLRDALSQERSDFTARFHRHHQGEEACQVSRARLIRYGRALRTGRLKAAIARLKHVRNTIVAHLDSEPANLPDGQRAIVHDFDRVIIAASIVVGEANVFVLGRTVNVPDLRKILREEAGGLVATLERGFNP
jgi:hypothetical protein